MADRLKFLPISFFSVVMGLTGLALALERAETTLGLGGDSGFWAMAAAGVIFALLALGYGAKLLGHWAEVEKELNHPIKLSFFPTVSISLILLGTASFSHHAGISFALWAAGASMQLALTLFVLSRWISHNHFEVHHSNPSWFIPVVGNILVPLAGVGHGQQEISWFFFSIGLVFWLVLLTIILYRFIFHPPLPQKLLPTFFILIAPPAVGFLSWMKLAGELDAFARILYYSALFTVLLLLALGPNFRGIKFFLSWWAYSFPTAAFAVATMVMFRETKLPFFEGLSWLTLTALVTLIATLLFHTLLAMKRGEICVEE